MPYTVRTDNPKLIAPEGMWRVVEIEVEISWISGKILRIGENPKHTDDFPLLCIAIAYADMRNMERMSNEDLPNVIFDDRGLFICNPFVSSRVESEKDREKRTQEEENWRPPRPHYRLPRT